MRRGTQAIAASSCCSTHEVLSPLDSAKLETTPVGRALLDARAPGFVAAPKPASRRAVARPTKGLRHWIPQRWKLPPWVGHCPTPMFLDASRYPSHRGVELLLDSRSAFATGFRKAGNYPRGSSFARRPRSWIRCCAQACIASSCCSTHEGPSPLDSATLETTPVGRALPDARVPGCVAVPKPSQRRAVARPTKCFRHWIPQSWKQPPWVELCSTPALLDSLLRPSLHRVELLLDPRKLLATRCPGVQKPRRPPDDKLTAGRGAAALSTPGSTTPCSARSASPCS